MGNGTVRWSPQQLADYNAKLKQGEVPVAKPSKPSKHKNKRVEWYGQWFDSHRELERYCWLLVSRDQKQIRDLHRQVTFVLAPAVQMEGNQRKTPALRYVADFIYVKDGELVVEDAKGFKTRSYLQKKHLMKTQHGIDILET